MAKPIRDIPAQHVGTVVQSFINNGESQLQVAQQTNGLFRVAPFSGEGRSFSAVPKFKNLLASPPADER